MIMLGIHLGCQVLRQFLIIRLIVLNMFCCGADDYFDPNIEKIQYQDSPLKVRILQTFGLKSFAINRFVFARPIPTYQMNWTQNGSDFVVNGIASLPPFGYHQTCTILNNLTCSIPLVHLQERGKKSKSLIIFSHGNGSDLTQALTFVSSLAEMHQAEYIAYDYSGYGLSQQKKTTTHSICADLQAIIAWVDRPLAQIILIGFSLGCYPTAKVASRYRVKGVILLAPMMSLISLLTEESRLGINTFFKNDELSTFEVVENIESHLLILHSKQDEIIPFRHSELIYQRYLKLSRNPSVDLIEIEQLKHNDTLIVLQSTLHNKLQQQFLQFLTKVEQGHCAQFYIEKKQKRQLQKRGKIGLELMHIMKQGNQNKRRSVEKVTELELKKIRDALKAE